MATLNKMANGIKRLVEEGSQNAVEGDANMRFQPARKLAQTRLEEKLACDKAMKRAEDVTQKAMQIHRNALQESKS